ncbi:MAG: inositol monophosphatase family protein [Elusimicrobia bacterium]|nr:inositol monophosphatase family protein [Elusimicrobiota bacterium]
MNNISKYFEATRKAVFRSSEILKKYFLGGFKVNYKSERNPVTTADKKSEKLIISLLKKEFPEVEFLCEESCNKKKKNHNGLLWILDPIDGTVNFMHGLPIFSISIALYNGNDALFGIVYNPVSKEFFHAIKGKGAYLNGKKINVSKTKDLKHSLIVTGFPYSNYMKNQGKLIKIFGKFNEQAEGVRRLGSAALDLCYVACGRFEGFWEEGLKPWDVAAGALIVKEAGGNVSDFSGNGGYLFGGSLFASNSKIHKKALEIIGGKR